MRRNPNLAEPIGVADQLVDIAPEEKKRHCTGSAAY